jgi:Ca2+-transporting ATPase
VTIIMVTGDQATTAAAIAGQAGLGGGPVLQGGEPLDRLADQELSARLASHTVVARATPADKRRIVRLLQGRGEIVAVTGDGINDAPALAAADVGITMGRRGTDLARQAAELILTDDAYPTVAAAIEGGRGIGSQLRRAVAFYLRAKLALVVAVGLPQALGLPSPFAPSTSCCWSCSWTSARRSHSSPNPPLPVPCSGRHAIRPDGS